MELPYCGSLFPASIPSDFPRICHKKGNVAHFEPDHYTDDINISPLMFQESHHRSIDTGLGITSGDPTNNIMTEGIEVSREPNLSGDRQVCLFTLNPL